nr:PREDICTED: fibrinogen C domain-containing protein 1 [Apteryx mantelli mantelli]
MQVAKLLTHAAQLRADCDGLKKGHSAMGQELGALQSEQGRLIQLVSRIAVVTWPTGQARGFGGLTGFVRDPSWHELDAGSRPRDCFDIYASGQQEDGIYSIFPTHHPSGFQVYCDMTTDGGGWTVSGGRAGRGRNPRCKALGDTRRRGRSAAATVWGLQRIHLLTVQASYELRVDLEDFDNGTAFARYGSFGVGLFSVDPEEDGYPVSVADYSGTAGDSFLKHNGMKFTTKDLDNDHSENNCAAFYHGAWWYRNCHTSNLNGQYLKGHHSSYADGIEWSSWTGWQYSLKFTEMKIRPVREEN